MTKEEAYRRMAKCMYDEMKFHQEHGERFKSNPNVKDVSCEICEDEKYVMATESSLDEDEECTDSEDEELQAKQDELRHRTMRMGETLASYPHIYPILLGWMVDVVGNDSESGVEDMKKVLSDLDFEDYIKRHGTIAATIQDFIRANGFRITDRGGGCENWHIGVPCNTRDAEHLCALLHVTFKDLIDRNIITVVKHFWGWRLPGLYNWNELEEYIIKNGTPE